MIKSAIGRRGVQQTPTVSNYKERYQHEGKNRNNKPGVYVPKSEVSNMPK